MQQTLKVQAVIRDGQAKLYPAGRPGAYLGWRECLPSEEAEHVIPGAPSTGDGFKPGKDVRLTRKESPGSQGLITAHVPYDRDMRKALQDGCLVLAEEPAPAPAPAPADTVPAAPRLPRGR